jgi:hypothetical protein
VCYRDMKNKNPLEIFGIKRDLYDRIQGYIQYEITENCHKLYLINLKQRIYREDFRKRDGKGGKTPSIIEVYWKDLMHCTQNM